MLTPKRDKFARFIAEGKDRLEAYDLAGFSQEQKPATRSNNAYMLMNNSEVIARIAEYKEEFAKLHKITYLSMIEELRKVEELALKPIHGRDKDSIDLTNLIKVKQEIIKVAGVAAPIKKELTGKDGTPLHPSKDYSVAELVKTISVLEKEYPDYPIKTILEKFIELTNNK